MLRELKVVEQRYRDAQAAVNAWRKEYNTGRPHQSVSMGFPSARFTRATSGVLELRIPAELARTAKSGQSGCD